MYKPDWLWVKRNTEQSLMKSTVAAAQSATRGQASPRKCSPKMADWAAKVGPYAPFFCTAYIAHVTAPITSQTESPSVNLLVTKRFLNTIVIRQTRRTSRFDATFVDANVRLIWTFSASSRKKNWRRNFFRWYLSSHQGSYRSSCKWLSVLVTTSILQNALENGAREPSIWSW